MRYNAERYMEPSMSDDFNTNKYLPLTESTYYILLALSQPLHGYGVMQKVEHISQGTVTIGPGTLYGAFQALEKEGLIQKVGEEERRKIYVLTSKGREILKKQIERLAIMVRSGSTLDLREEK
jgi:DNA-binding PadR family transcriptional regulator